LSRSSRNDGAGSSKNHGKFKKKGTEGKKVCGADDWGRWGVRHVLTSRQTVSFGGARSASDWYKTGRAKNDGLQGSDSRLREGA